MTQLHVPQLLNKLKLLIENSDISNMAEIADRLGKKPETLRSWTKGLAGNTVPATSRENFLDLYVEYLPNQTRFEVEQILQGPTDLLVFAFLQQDQTGLSILIKRQALFKGAKLILGQGKSHFPDRIKKLFRRFVVKKAEKFVFEDLLDMPQIVIVKTTPDFDPADFVPLGEEFRIEFPIARRAKYYLALQQSSQGWGAIAAAPLRNGKIVFVPEPLTNGEPATMCEYHDHGPSRFALIQSMRPFPTFVHANLRDNVPLSRADIGALAQHIKDTPKADRTIHAIDVLFVRTSD